MKPAFVALTVAVALGIARTANAWLGDPQDALIRRYGKPVLVQLTTGDIPTQRGYYAELKENYSTNVSLIAAMSTNYNDIGYGMDLAETRPRDIFQTNGMTIAVYLGNAGETYNGADFSGRSVREILNSGSVWQKDSFGDKFTHPVPLSPAVISSFLADNQGESQWAEGWQPSGTPGTWLKRSAGKARMAIAHGASEQQIYQLEFRMVSDTYRGTQ